MERLTESRQAPRYDPEGPCSNADCSLKRGDGRFKTCETCRAYFREHRHKVYVARVAARVCYRCGENPPEKGGACGPCSEYLAERAYERKARLGSERLCPSCGTRPARKNRIKCGVCGARDTESAKRTRTRRIPPCP